MCYTAHIVGLSWTIMDYPGLSWIIVDYNGLWTMVDYHGLSWIMDYHGLSCSNGSYHGLWTVMDHCGLLWHIVDYCGFLNTHHHRHGLQDMHPKPLTTPERYGAGMAHTVASIGHVLSCSYCG